MVIMVCGGVDVHQTGERRPMISNRAVWQQRGCGLDDRCVLVPVRTHEVITIGEPVERVGGVVVVV